MASIERKTIDELHALGITGKGVKIAVIDGGFAKPNKNLTIKQSINFDNNNIYSDHATACASIIKSSEFGIAPDCELYSVAITNNTVSVESAKDLARYIIWCADNDMDIISISMGYGESIQCIELEEACMYADKAGCIIVAGAGNNANQSDLDHSYIIIPAAYDYTICVSNVDKNTNKINNLSSCGYGIDFAGYGDGNKAYNIKGETYLFAGTSSSTPYVAGCIALLKQQAPEINRIEVYDILKSNAIKLDNKEKSFQYGYGLVKPLLIHEGFNYRKREFLQEKSLIRDIYFEDIIINIEAGKVFQPSFKYYPNEKESTFVCFKSSNTDIVTINEQNNVAKALREGNTTITAFLGNGKKAQAKINVYKSSSTDIENRETLKSLGVYDAWKNGFRGEGVKVGYIGWGCIDTDKIRIKERYSIYDNMKLKECNNGTGTQISSLISGTGVGIAPDCDYYVLNPCFNIAGMGGFNDMEKCAEWALSKKLDIVFIRNIEYTKSAKLPSSFDVCKPENVKRLIQKMHDNGMIIVTIIDEDGSNPLSSLITTENTLTISFVTDKKEYPAKNPMKSKWIDCVSYGYGMDALDSTNEQIKITDSYINDIWTGEYYSAAYICGILALLKQQNPNLKTAQDIRKILPQLCEELYGGKNDKTGYGLLKAFI